MNEYQKSLCLEASKVLRESIRLLNNAEYGLFQIEDGESMHEFYKVTQTMLNELHQYYYAKSEESKE